MIAGWFGSTRSGPSRRVSLGPMRSNRAAVLSTWLHNRTGSVMPAMVLHGGLTAGQDNLTLLPGEVHGVTDVAIGIAYAVGIAAVLLRTRGRLGLPGGRSVPVAGPQASVDRDVAPAAS